jgi:hypothetical protein
VDTSKKLAAERRTIGRQPACALAAAQRDGSSRFFALSAVDARHGVRTVFLPLPAF